MARAADRLPVGAGFGAACRAAGRTRTAGAPLVLLDEHGRVLTVDARPARPGSRSASPNGRRRRTARRGAAPGRPLPALGGPGTVPGRIKGYTDRWQPDGLGRVYLDATGLRCRGRLPVEARTPELVSEPWRPRCGSLGWQPALGATGSKFGASVAGQVAWQNAALLLAPAAQRAFLAGQPIHGLAAGHRRADPTASPGHPHPGAIRAPAGHRRAGPLRRPPAARRSAGRKAWTTGRCSRPGRAPRSQRASSSRRRWSDRERLLAALIQRADRLLVPLRDRLQAVARILLHSHPRRRPDDPGQPHLPLAHGRGRAGAPGAWRASWIG